MRPVSAPRVAGFTLTEALIALAVIALMLGLGMPRMSDWIVASKAASATEFYAEGLALARAQAVTHNSASRFLLLDNTKNGQLDWRVDICFPTVAVPCDEGSGDWSTAVKPAARDPEGAAGFKSVFRSADALPADAALAITLSPAGATDVYFTSLGWVNTTFSPRLERIGLAPTTARAGAFPAAAVVLTIGGIASKCDPAAALHSARRCPP